MLKMIFSFKLKLVINNIILDKNTKNLTQKKRKSINVNKYKGKSWKKSEKNIENYNKYDNNKLKIYNYLF